MNDESKERRIKVKRVELPKVIEAYLRGFVWARRRFALVRAAGVTVGFAVGWMLVSCLVDRVMSLPGWVRLAMLVVGVVGVVIVSRPLGRLLFRRIDWLVAAGGVEKVNRRFRDRLRTVVSQLMERREYRGSEPMIGRLVAEVSAVIERDERRRWVKWGEAMWAWGWAGALALVGGALWLVPWVGMGTLAERMVRPWAYVAPVTRTRIAVEPGDTNVVSGGALVIRAKVEKPGAGGVDVFTSADGAAWSRIAMLPASENEYSFTLSGVDRDVRYYVEAGDATTRVFVATVLREPAVAEWRVRYEYPKHTGRGALAVSSADGVVEAVVGTMVGVTLVSTEPLRGAVLRLNGGTIEMKRAGDAKRWQGEFVVDKSGVADLEMTSSGGLAGRVKKALDVRATVDRGPVVRLVQPGEDLRLNPRALMGMWYQAMDDYGLAELGIEARVNAGSAVSVPVGRRGDARRLEGRCVLDLAGLNVKVGDVVTVGLVGVDGAGHRASSETRRILVSSRSIEVSTHARIAELKQASALGARVSGELEAATEALEAARRTDGVQAEYAAARTKAGAGLAGAVEGGLLLHQALLRACGKSASAQQTAALAGRVDAARVAATGCEKLADAEAVGASEQVMIDQLRTMIEAAQRLAGEVKLISEGEQAAAILVERANLTQPREMKSEDKTTAELVKETVRRARQEVDWAVEEMGLRVGSPDLEEVLKRKVEAAEEFVRTRRGIDWETAARQWVTGLAKGEAGVLAERLASAASVEAMRPDADPVAARDWQLASKAAGLAGRLMASGGAAEAKRMAEELPNAIGVLQREHERVRSSAGDRGAAELAGLRQAAEGVRAKLVEWVRRGGEAGAEELAMEASAATAKRDYRGAGRVDQKLGTSVGEGMEPVRIAMERVERIDRTSQEQAAINEQTEKLRKENEAAARKLASQQQAMAETIHRIDETDDLRAGLMANAESRRSAMAGVQRVQEELAHVPQQLTAAGKAAEAYRSAASLVEDARRAAAASTGDEQAAALRAVDLAVDGVREAAKELEAAAAGLSKEAAERMAKELVEFEPETSEAVEVIKERLGPAMETAREAMRGAEKAAVDRAGMRVRGAIEVTQAALRDAQARMIESDPLVVARWYAESAAAALSQKPVDVGKARGQQQNVTSALGKAWQGAVREAANERLGLVGGYRSLLSPGDGGKGGIEQVLPGMRQWGYLGARGEAGLGGTREREAAGYEEAVRVYFEYLGKR